MKIPTPPTRSTAGLTAAVLLGLSGLAAYGQETITQTEPDDSIGTANATGFTPGSSGVKVAYGHTGDGPHGGITGDVDFFRVPLAAGQKLLVNMANAGIDPDFDPFVAVYNSAGEVVAENDDKGNTTRGYDRTPRLEYVASAAGDYFVCVSNWIADADSNLPSDPFTPGTVPGLPGGNAGPYQLIIAVDAELPVPQFVGGSTGYPVPAFLPAKVFGTPRYDGRLTISNRSAGTTDAANYVINGYTVTGPDAGKFLIRGLVPPVTIPPGGEITVDVSFNAAGSGAPAEATIEFDSNDPLNSKFVLNTSRSPVVGGGLFTVRQINAPAGTAVNSMSVADDLLSGAIEGGEETLSTTPGINFGSGADGHFGQDTPFPNGGTNPENVVLQVTGTFQVRTPGKYTFLGYSDDGQRLKIDGVELYSYDDYNTDHLATVELTAGPHTLEFTMFEGGGGNHAELAISQQPGEYEEYMQTTWEILEAVGGDSDGDELPDAYEIAVGLNPESAAGDDGAAGDPDGDGVPNSDEYFFGTNPKVADTDGDGLSDGVETGTGVWVDASNRGTNPLSPDSDNDGIPDGAEDYAAANGSDPNRKDTDGDGYADGTELSVGTDPKSAASVPSFSFLPVLADDFDGGSLHSVTTFTSLNNSGAFDAGIYESGVASHGNVLQLTEEINSIHNTAFFDYVDLPSAPALRLSVDFRFTVAEGVSPADGFGIGLFRKSVYGTNGATPAITDSRAWENPTGAGGYGDALFIGFGFYGGNVVRVAGPEQPGTALASVPPPFNYVNGVFNRAIITVLANTPSSSMLRIELVEDVDGVATSRVLVDNLLIPGFVVDQEEVRLITGGRTGGLNARIDLDNISLSVPTLEAPVFAYNGSHAGLQGTLYDTAGTAVDPATVRITVAGTELAVTATKSESVTTITATPPAGSFLPPGISPLVLSYSDSGGTVHTEERSIEVPFYKLLPSSLALPASAGVTRGFNVRTVQMHPLTVNDATQTTPNSLDYMEGILAGVSGSPFEGGNVADLTGAVDGFFHVDVINFEQDGFDAGYFGDNSLIPGIPGTTGTTDNYVYEALTWLEFPAAGIYQFGVVADDGFRVSYGHDPVPALTIVSPAASARTIPYLPSVQGSQLGGIGGPYPDEPFVADVVVADPVIASDENGVGVLNNAADVAGKIVLIDRGVSTFATKILVAQEAGAKAVIIVNENNPDSVPGILGGEAAGITIPAGMISKSDGDALKALVGSGLQLRFGPDTSTTIGSADLNQTTLFTAAVSAPGLYPVRFLNFEGGGGAHAEWFSIDSEGERHLVNDPQDSAALRAWSAVSAVPAPVLSIAWDGSAATVTFTGTLQSSTDLNTWTDVPGAASPYTVPANSGPRLFFRAR